MALATTDIGARVHYNATTKTQSVTLTSGVDLLVVRHVNVDNAEVVTAMSYNSASLTKCGTATPNTGTATIWFKVAPTTGSAQNLVITLDGSSHSCDFDWLGFTGAHQTTPLLTPLTTGSTGTSMSRTITDGAVGDTVIDVGYINQTGGAPGTVAVANGQTADSNGANSTAAADPYMASSHVAGGASVTTGWTWTGSKANAFIAVDVKAAAAVTTGAKNLLLLGVG